MHDTSKIVKSRFLGFPGGPGGPGAAGRPRRIGPGAAGGPRRIAVVGRAGAGKTTVALELGRALRLPVVHLDRLAWGPGWHPVEPLTFGVRHAAAISGDAWVLDGGYLARAGWPERLRRADMVVLVEAPLLVCLWRLMRRSRTRPSGDPRPDLPDGC
jgi:adenylate kinase family enzyme